MIIHIANKLLQLIDIIDRRFKFPLRFLVTSALFLLSGLLSYFLLKGVMVGAGAIAFGVCVIAPFIYIMGGVLLRQFSGLCFMLLNKLLKNQIAIQERNPEPSIIAIFLAMLAKYPQMILYFIVAPSSWLRDKLFGLFGMAKLSFWGKIFRGNIFKADLSAVIPSVLAMRAEAFAETVSFDTIQDYYQNYLISLNNKKCTTICVQNHDLSLDKMDYFKALKEKAGSNNNTNMLTFLSIHEKIECYQVTHKNGIIQNLSQTSIGDNEQSVSCYLVTDGVLDIAISAGGYYQQIDSGYGGNQSKHFTPLKDFIDKIISYRDKNILKTKNTELPGFFQLLCYATFFTDGSQSKSIKQQVHEYLEYSKLKNAQ